MSNALTSQLFPGASTVTADTRWLDEDEQADMARLPHRPAPAVRPPRAPVAARRRAPARLLRDPRPPLRGTGPDAADEPARRFVAVVAQPALPCGRAAGGGGLGAPPRVCRGPARGVRRAHARRPGQAGGVGARARRGRPGRPVRRTRPRPAARAARDQRRPGRTPVRYRGLACGQRQPPVWTPGSRYPPPASWSANQRSTSIRPSGTNGHAGSASRARSAATGIHHPSATSSGWWRTGPS